MQDMSDVDHREERPVEPISRAGRYWAFVGLLLPVALIGAGAYIVAGLGRDTRDEGTTIAEVRGLNRLSISVRDFEVPLRDQAAKLSWEVHYKLYRMVADSLQHSPHSGDIAGYLTGIDASVRRLSGFYDALLTARAAGSNTQGNESAYRSEIDYAQEIVTGATDASMHRLSVLAVRVDSPLAPTPRPERRVVACGDCVRDRPAPLSSGSSAAAARRVRIARQRRAGSTAARLDERRDLRGRS